MKSLRKNYISVKTSQRFALDQTRAGKGKDVMSLTRGQWVTMAFLRHSDVLAPRSLITFTRLLDPTRTSGEVRYRAYQGRREPHTLP